MKLRRGIALFLTAFVLAVLYIHFQPFTKHYDGKTIPQWFEAIEVTTTNLGTPGVMIPSVREEDPAILALKRIGSDSVPYVIDSFQWVEPGWRKSLDQMAAKLPIRKGLTVEARCYARAVSTLASMGPVASNAVPALVSVSKGKDRGRAWAALVLLGKIHQQSNLSLPPLVQALKSPIFQVRLAAVESLGKFGADAKSALIELRPLLYDNEGIIRAAAAQTIGQIDGTSGDTVKRILFEFSNTPSARLAEILASFGPGAKAAIPRLLSEYEYNLNFTKPDRDRLRKAIKQIDPEAAAKAGIQ